MSSVGLSVTIIALNEAHQLARTIESIQWADDVVVVDSGSSDGTQELARSLGARVIEQPWLGFGRQKNLAQDQARQDWVLNLDADEVVSPELRAEIQAWLLDQQDSMTKGGPPGHLAFPRKNFYRGQWIRHGGWYPNILVRLGHRSNCRWTEPHLHESLQSGGARSVARNPLLHYTFRSIAHQVRTNLRYAQDGANELKRKGQSYSLIRLIAKPIGKFIETYLLKRGFLDGRLGFIISVNAAHSMFLKQAFLTETETETSGTHG